MLIKTILSYWHLKLDIKEPWEKSFFVNKGTSLLVSEKFVSNKQKVRTDK